jgi:uncharacterized protein YoxC
MDGASIIVGLVILALLILVLDKVEKIQKAVNEIKRAIDKLN